MNSEELDEVEGLATELRIKSGWIRVGFASKVYFRNCLCCGAAFSSHRGNQTSCKVDCSIKSNGIDDVRLVGSGKYEVKIVRRGRLHLLGLYYDFFEACCARKSAENRYPNYEVKPTATIGKRNTSGIMGVSWPKDRDYVTAKITSSGKAFLLYRGTDFFEACCVRKSAEQQRCTIKGKGKIKACIREPIVTRPQKNTPFGIVGVKWNIRTRKFIAGILYKGKKFSLGNYHDFFEACCARKSAENRLLEGGPILPRLRHNNKTGISGVRYDEWRSGYVVTITSSGKKNYLGSYKCLFEACCVRKSAEANINIGAEVNLGNCITRNVKGNNRYINGVNLCTKKLRGNDVSIFRAKIRCNKKEYHLYYGADFFEACCARKSAESRILQGTFIN